MNAMCRDKYGFRSQVQAREFVHWLTVCCATLVYSLSSSPSLDSYNTTMILASAISCTFCFLYFFVEHCWWNSQIHPWSSFSKVHLLPVSLLAQYSPQANMEWHMCAPISMMLGWSLHTCYHIVKWFLLDHTTYKVVLVPCILPVLNLIFTFHFILWYVVTRWHYLYRFCSC